MSDIESTTPSQPQSDLLDLSSLRMMPAWVGDIGKEEKIKERFADREERPQRGDRNDRRGGGGGGGGAGFGEQRRFGGGAGGGAGGRPGGPPRGDRRDGPGGPPRGDRRDGGGGRGGEGRGPRRFDDRNRDGDARPQREWVPIPQDVQVTVYPEDKTLDTLAQHVRNTGHAFSMFDASRLVLAGGDRFHVRFLCAENRPTPLFQSTVDGGLYLSRDEAITQVLNGPALDSYYRSEEIELEAPKGDFKSVAICGLSGEILGPPSHHSYQTGLMRIHRERFGNMSLEDYKRRIRVDAAPEQVEKWKEKCSKGRRWVYLKAEVPEGTDPQTFATRAEVDAHFRRMHAADAVLEVRDVRVQGNIDKSKLSHVLFIMLRQSVENARKHLFELSQKLSAGLERRGLKMFKRRAGKLFVSGVRPRAIDAGVVFSDRVAKIVEVLKQSAGLPVQKLVEAISPSAEKVDGEAPKQLTDDQVAVIKDIRWLANEGYVIEYSDNMVFLGVQGEAAVKKEAPGAKDAAPAAEAVAVEEETAEEISADTPAPVVPAVVGVLEDGED